MLSHLNRRVPAVAMTALPTSQMVQRHQRPFFSVFEKAKDRFGTPLKHIQSFMEPNGNNYESQLPDGYRLHGNSAASFSASIT